MVLLYTGRGNIVIVGKLKQISGSSLYIYIVNNNGIAYINWQLKPKSEEFNYIIIIQLLFIAVHEIPEQFSGKISNNYTIIAFNNITKIFENTTNNNRQR